MPAIKAIAAPTSVVNLELAEQVESKLSRTLASVQNLAQRLKQKTDAGAAFAEKMNVTAL
jgi:hypothetical protein